MNPLLGGALGSNIAEKKRVQALVWCSHTRDSASNYKFAGAQSAKTANIMCLENLALYGRYIYRKISRLGQLARN